ncbi:MAG: chemotaxis protein CheW [Thermodesulfovibrionia bacterium]
MGRFIIFTISGEEFGIEISKVIEIIRPQKAIGFPGVPAYVSGVFNLRGSVIPLIDMRKRLNVMPRPNREKILIVRLHEGKVGLLVDSVREILNIDEKMISPPPSIFKGLKTEHIKGIGRVNDRLIIIFNLDNLITLEEITMLEDITEKSAISPGELHDIEGGEGNG